MDRADLRRLLLESLPPDTVHWGHSYEGMDGGFVRLSDAHLLLVVADGMPVVATMQLSFLPGLSRRGALRFYARLGLAPSHEGLKLDLRH